MTVPSSILQDRSFAVLETIVAYIKDSYSLNYHEMGLLLGRDERTVWTCYHRIKDKQKHPFKRYPNSIDIPLHVIKNRSVSILESIVLYLKDIQNLSYHEIAVLLNRNDRTIWTVYNRAKKKEAKR